MHLMPPKRLVAYLSNSTAMMHNFTFVESVFSVLKRTQTVKIVFYRGAFIDRLITTIVSFMTE